MAVGFGRGPREGMPGSAAGTALSFNRPQREQKGASQVGIREAGQGHVVKAEVSFPGNTGTGRAGKQRYEVCGSGEKVKR